MAKSQERICFEGRPIALKWNQQQPNHFVGSTQAHFWTLGNRAGWKREDGLTKVGVWRPFTVWSEESFRPCGRSFGGSLGCPNGSIDFPSSPWVCAGVGFCDMPMKWWNGFERNKTFDVLAFGDTCWGQWTLLLFPAVCLQISEQAASGCLSVETRRNDSGFKS